MAKVPIQNANLHRELKGEIYNSLREALIKPISSKSKKTWTEEYIELMLKEARSNPNSAIGQWITKQLMQDDILSKLDEQTERALAKDVDFLEYRLIKQLYDKQREIFLDDKITNKIIIGSRRIGKTTLATRLLTKDCIKPNHHALFIGLKFENAIRQAYPETVAMAQSIGLRIAKESKNEGLIEFYNGSTILFKGNYNKRDADTNFQGDKYSLVIIDEAQSQPNLKHLIDDLIRPAMSDYKDAQLILTGTPPRIKGTYVEKIWNEYSGWKKYTWNMGQNPYICSGDRTLDTIIEAICEEKKVTRDAPFIQREYEGKWVVDIEAQVFKDYTSIKNIPSTFSPTDIAIGVDFGFADNNSMIALAYNRNTKRGFTIAERKFNKATITEIVEVCRAVYEHSKKFALERAANFDFSKIGFYCDTNEQSISFELSSKYGLPVYNAYKYNKELALAQLADWCRMGNIVVQEEGVLSNEFEMTVYKRDDLDNILSEIDDDLYHPDGVDALLYASRQFAFDIGAEVGGESSDKKTKINKAEARKATQPDFITAENINDYNEEWIR